MVVKLVFLVLAELHETPQAAPSIPRPCGGCCNKVDEALFGSFESRQTTLSWQKDRD